MMIVSIVTKSHILADQGFLSVEFFRVLYLKEYVNIFLRGRGVIPLNGVLEKMYKTSYSSIN